MATGDEVGNENCDKALSISVGFAGERTISIARERWNQFRTLYSTGTSGQYLLTVEDLKRRFLAPELKVLFFKDFFCIIM